MPAETIVKSINENRRSLKAFAQEFVAFIKEVKSAGLSLDTKSDNPEIIANLMLAYRHLEDASMRMGKAIQAADGGVSVYDKETTVGAPDAPVTPNQYKDPHDSDERHD